MKTDRKYRDQLLSFFLALALHGVLFLVPIRTATEPLPTRSEAVSVFVPVREEVQPEAPDGGVLPTALDSQSPTDEQPGRAELEYTQREDSPEEEAFQEDSPIESFDSSFEDRTVEETFENEEPLEDEDSTTASENAAMVSEGYEDASSTAMDYHPNGGDPSEDTASPYAGFSFTGDRTQLHSVSQGRSVMGSGEDPQAEPSVSDKSKTSSPAQPLSAIKPDYPQAARMRGLEGTVRILAHIDPEGRVSEATVEKSSGYALLDEAACKAVRASVFKPAVRAGTSIASSVIIPLRFVLTEE